MLWWHFKVVLLQLVDICMHLFVIMIFLPSMLILTVKKFISLLFNIYVSNQWQMNEAAMAALEDKLISSKSSSDVTPFTIKLTHFEQALSKISPSVSELVWFSLLTYEMHWYLTYPIQLTRFSLLESSKYRGTRLCQRPSKQHEKKYKLFPEGFWVCLTAKLFKESHGLCENQERVASLCSPCISTSSWGKKFC